MSPQERRSPSQARRAFGSDDGLCSSVHVGLVAACRAAGAGRRASGAELGGIGVDPTFLRNSELYRPELALADYYNTSAVRRGKPITSARRRFPFLARLSRAMLATGSF